MAKAQGKGVFVGAKIKVGFPKFGQKKDGTNWQLFTYKESKKNVETGEFDELGRYTIFVNNPQSSLQNGDLVEIKSITKSLIEKNIVNNKEYININCWCDIETNNYVENNNNEIDLEIKEMEVVSFDNNFTSEDDFPF